MAIFNDDLIDRIGKGLALAIGVFLFILVGCQASIPGAEISQGTLTSQVTVTARPSQTPTIESSPTVTATGVLTTGDITLTFWTIEDISPEAEGQIGDFVRDNLRAFERANPDLGVNLLLKKASGKGGVLDFLRTGREVAPTVLPDVAIMNATDLQQAYNEGLLQPLDGQLDRSIVQDLLPAARRTGTVDNKLVGVPLGLEMEHTVYNTLFFTATPMLWTDVLSNNTRYLFPAKGVNGLVNDATLAQYFSAGGELRDDQGTPKIDEQALRSVLDFYQRALDANVIDAAILEAATSEELWPTYLEGNAGMTHITVRQYLSDRDFLENSLFAPIPVADEKDIPVTITQGWVIVLIANDATRQEAALRLMEWFLSTPNNATWNELNKSIPARDTAYQQLAGDDPYWEFLTQQLNNTRTQPNFMGYDQIGRIIQQALEQVIRGEATPAEATATAIDALTP